MSKEKDIDDGHYIKWTRYYDSTNYANSMFANNEKTKFSVFKTNNYKNGFSDRELRYNPLVKRWFICGRKPNRGSFFDFIKRFFL